MTNVTHKFLFMYLFLFLTLYMFRAHRAHHQEREIVSIQPLVAVALFWWPCRVQVGSEPDDEHDVLETCRVKNKNKYIERNLCVTLVIYQEYLHRDFLIRICFTEDTRDWIFTKYDISLVLWSQRFIILFPQVSVSVCNTCFVIHSFDVITEICL
jgi:hypothetical protein